MDKIFLASFLTNVAKGLQENAEHQLQTSTDKQILLRFSGKFCDYSDRHFDCSAYEYAYWALDTHMCRMLERYMDNETKAYLLKKIEKIEQSGLCYQQHQQIYQNPHYDSSFILKNLKPNDFKYLKKLLTNHSELLEKINTLNYQQYPFSGADYANLIQELSAKKNRISVNVSNNLLSWFILQYQNFKIEQLIKRIRHAFDFHSLVTALQNYVDNYDTWNYQERDTAWLLVGKAQRDVPMHIAAEYCRNDRSFEPLPSFHEKTLPRDLKFDNYVSKVRTWFPLCGESKGLGYDFALGRQGRRAPWCWGVAGRPTRSVWAAAIDLAAVRHLIQVRTDDLSQSRKNLHRLNK